MKETKRYWGLSVSLIVHASFVQVVTYSLRPTISYRALEVGVDEAFLGLLAAVFAVFPVVFALPIGRAADRGHLKWAFLCGASAQFAAGFMLLFWSGHVFILALGGLILGAGHVMGIVAQQTLVTRFARFQLDRAFGAYTFFGTLGQAAGPLMLYVLGGSGRLLNTTAIFLSAVISAAIVLAVIPSLKKQTRDTARIKGKTLELGSSVELDSSLSSRRCRYPRLVTSVVVSMFILALVDIISIYLPAWGVQTGFDASIVAMFLLLRAVGMLIGRLFVTSVVNKLGRGPAQVWMSLTAAAAAAVLFFQLI